MGIYSSESGSFKPTPYEWMAHFMIYLYTYIVHKSTFSSGFLPSFIIGNRFSCATHNLVNGGSDFYPRIYAPFVFYFLRANSGLKPLYKYIYKKCFSGHETNYWTETWKTYNG